MSKPKIGIVIAGAGSSARYGMGDKLLENLQGMPVFLHSIKEFYSLSSPGNLILVTRAEKIVKYRQLAEKFLPGLNIKYVSGGATRGESVLNGVKALETDCEIVAIHDAARPLSTAEFLQKLIDSAQKHGAVIAARRENDSLKRVNEAGEIIDAPDRNGIWKAETPQLFRLDWLLDAYYRKPADKNFTDDAEVLRAAGYTVRVLQVDHINPKLTYSEDLELVRALLSNSLRYCSGAIP